MPEKDPHFLAAMWNLFWVSLPEPIKAAVIATVVAGLRVMYDDKEPRQMRRILEAVLCGVIAFGVASGVEAMGWSSGMATFLGGFVGLIGADKVRELGKVFAERRAGGDR